ncbi:hypothetical protein KPH14_001357 [Odynerus spinipes]|uniref:Sulfotransferase domain-containing protein n=1 Tax=Odynerus spinipes TaxID=1348599 RepID=A0AAD9VKJ8_9HYME|nr:hypothetical protein KPH14_001357 [Odynerus spinipes]
MTDEIPKCVPFEGEDKELARKHVPIHENGFVKVGENKWTMPYNFLEKGPAVYNIKPRPDDTWVATYPRSGTTWTLELVWLVVNDMNFEGAKSQSLHHRFPFVDLDLIVSHYNPKESEIIDADAPKLNPEFIDSLPSPRFIKTHMPFDLLPNLLDSGCKVVYVARNPKDMVVSWYNFYKDMKELSFQGSFEDFCEYFMKDLCIYSPYWKHLKDAWAERHRPNLLYIFYEELKNDMPGTIKRVAEFFGKSYSDEQIAKLADHLQIDNFRKNPMVNSPAPKKYEALKPSLFIRQGKVGGWKELFTPELNAKFDAWIKENLKDTDFAFPVNVVQGK